MVFCAPRRGAQHPAEALGPSPSSEEIFDLHRIVEPNDPFAPQYLRDAATRLRNQYEVAVLVWPDGVAAILSGEQSGEAVIQAYWQAVNRWQKARKRAGLPQVRVHDLKHTFGRRLRAAGGSFEDRQDLLGHKAGRMTSHYSAAELSNLIEAAEKACQVGSRKSPAVVALKQKSGWRGALQPLDVYGEFWRARQDLNPRPPGS